MTSSISDSSKTSSLINSHSRGIVHAISDAGHRASYLELFSGLLDLSPICRPLSISSIVDLIKTPRLLISTLDDSIAAYLLIGAVRSMQGKPTAAIFLRPHSCFVASNGKSTVKRILLSFCSKIPMFTIVSITPFSLEPALAQVTSVGTRDPQYWDLHHPAILPRSTPTALSDSVRDLSNGRQIIVFLGSASKEKGFDFLSDILHRDPDIARTAIIVAAGFVSADMRPYADRFQAAGGFLADRFLEVDELKSLYGVADAVWACYSPEYDQASGIFGRAIQLGIPTIVRRGSILDRLRSDIATPIISLPYRNLEAGARVLRGPFPQPLDLAALAEESAKFKAWGAEFVDCMNNALAPRGESDEV